MKNVMLALKYIFWNWMHEKKRNKKENKQKREEMHYGKNEQPSLYFLCVFADDLSWVL